MKLVPVDAMRRMPQKNGGGVTIEIAIAPVGATLDHFDWRVSTTQVDTAGPFSRFVGIDRSLAVITDGRLMMHRTEAETVMPAPGEAPACFPGRAGVHATLDAPLSDFNVMTQRDAWAHHAEAITFAAGERRSLPRLHADMQWLVYCMHGVLPIGADDVPQGVVAWLDVEGDPDTVIARVGSVGYLVALWPIG